MKAAAPAELDKLFAEVGTYRSTKEYGELLQFIRRFRRYAPYNAMLLHVQKPGSRYVASASDWEQRFNRRPIPGARPLVILRPFGPVAFVYELNDTEGDPLPQEIEDPFMALGEITDAKVEDFIERAYFDGFGILMQNYGTDYAGQVSVIHETGTFMSKGVQKTFHIPFAVAVNSNLNPAAKLATIYHELGHVYCGHLYNKDAKYLPQRYNLTHEQEEFEAESVCWLLCEREGIENPSAAYLSGYLENNDEIPPISIDTVLRAVGAVEQIWNKPLTPRKELIVNSQNN